MITEEQINKIAEKLEAEFGALMTKAGECYARLKDVFDEHERSGCADVCNESGISADPSLDGWDKVTYWSNRFEGAYLSFTKRMGLGCRFGRLDCMSEIFGRYRERVFGSSSASALDFVRKNLRSAANVITARTRIDSLVMEEIPQLNKAVEYARRFLAEITEMARERIRENDAMLLAAFCE